MIVFIVFIFCMVYCNGVLKLIGLLFVFCFIVFKVFFMFNMLVVDSWKLSFFVMFLFLKVIVWVDGWFCFRVIVKVVVVCL